MCSSCNPLSSLSPSFDSAQAELFAGQMLGMINGAAGALMCSIGHRTGLFDAMAGLPPSTSREIADSAGLDERYVREWLGAMVTSRIVEFDPTADCYSLPAERAHSLTRSSDGNIAVVAQFIGELAQAETEIVNCFREGGGVPYSSYPRFHEVMAEESDQTVVAALVDQILPLVPGLSERLEAGIDVLDIGCGRAHAMFVLAERFPHSRFHGYDLSLEAIEWAQAEAHRRDLPNLSLRRVDLTTYEADPAFDLVTAFDAIHDQARPDRVLETINDSLREGGVFLMQDIAASSRVENNMDRPLAPFMYTISTMHCMTVSLAQGGIGLGACWGQELALEMLGKAGFGDVSLHQLEHDISNDFYVCRR